VKHAVATSLGAPCGVAVVCGELGLARSSYYAELAATISPPVPPAKRGPKTAYTDEALTGHIRRVIEESPFSGEGHRKVWARLRRKGIRTSKARALRLMRLAGLLAPSRARKASQAKAHDGRIVTKAPDEMWGTDATRAYTLEDGPVTVFIGVDHCTAECVGIHAAKVGNRFEALEPIRQGLREHFDGYEKDVAKGLKVRHDHGSQYMSDHFQAELRFLGIESSPAFVREPEGNGCAERFILTLKQQVLWVECFRNVEELRKALLAFKDLYNRQWLIERLGHITPAAARAKLGRGRKDAA